MPGLCSRKLTAFGNGWVKLEAVWNVGGERQYLEIAMFGASAGGKLGFYSFTSDGKRSEGHLSDGRDVHPAAIAFEAKMPAGLARMIYWPVETRPGFNFAVESKTTKGWNRFLRHEYRPD